MPENAQNPPSPFENAPKLLPPPKPNEWTTYLVCAIMAAFAYHAYLNENWFGVAIDIGLIVFNVTFAYFYRRSSKRLWNQYEILKELEKIMATPRMQEIGHSVIFTVLFPSPEILKKLEKNMRHGH